MFPSFGFRFAIAQTHDISNPSYMGLSFKVGNVKEKGWSYNMLNRGPDAAGQMGKDSKKAGYDLSPTAKVSSG